MTNEVTTASTLEAIDYEIGITLVVGVVGGAVDDGNDDGREKKL